MPQQKGNTDCIVFVCAYATLRQRDLKCKLFDQTHNQRMRFYIFNVNLTNETPPLTQVELNDTQPRQETMVIIENDQQASAWSERDVNKRKTKDTHEKMKIF